MKIMTRLPGPYFPLQLIQLTRVCAKSDQTKPRFYSMRNGKEKKVPQNRFERAVGECLKCFIYLCVQFILYNDFNSFLLI